MRYLLPIFALLTAAPAFASPPPPPPEYLDRAAQLLAAQPAEVASSQALFADDVTVFENGRMVAQGKASWLKWRGDTLVARGGRTLGYSEGYLGQPVTVLILDTYDTVDRSTLPPTAIADPRMATRATLYEFGPDRLIHAVHISRTNGFWVTPRR